ncbi:hypothetical protein ACFV1C_34500 [Streptomyces sp. NPDC059605]|uniref:hypothetical protein n=1 Tax=unclassified Streptomyces TaxID=2593676 RepID=UPI0036B391F3
MSTETAAPDSGSTPTSPGPGPGPADSGPGPEPEPEPEPEPATTGRPRRRTVKRVLGIGAPTLALAAGGGYPWLSSTATVHNTGNPDTRPRAEK